MSRCVVSIVVCFVVLRSCSCCCPGILAITVYCCILFFVLFFFFLLLLLLSVVCRQHLLLSRRPSFVVICLPLLVAITVYCCFICVVLCRIVSHCAAKLWLKLIWLRLQDKKNIEFNLKNRTLYSYFLDAFSAFIQFAGTLYYAKLYLVIISNLRKYATCTNYPIPRQKNPVLNPAPSPAHYQQGTSELTDTLLSVNHLARPIRPKGSEFQLEIWYILRMSLTLLEVSTLA